MNIVHCALTGFGNAVLKHLTEQGLKPKTLITRKESGPFPYYKEENIRDLATRLDVPIRYDLPKAEWFEENKIDLLLISTFDRIIPMSTVRAVRWAVNLHPSILPAYRGASPCYWTLRNGERQTGLTLHLLTEKIDAGDIVGQVMLPVDQDETQGSLRLKLASFGGPLVADFIRRVNQNKVTASKQNDEDISSFPRFTDADRQINLSNPQEVQERHLRALLPWPGGLVGNQEVVNLEQLKLLNASNKARSIDSLVFESKGTKLIQMDESHLAKTFEWMQDENLRRQIDSVGPPPQWENHGAIWRGRFKNPERNDFAILCDGVHVGNTGLMDISLLRKKAELWIYIGDSRGEGVGSRAIHLLVKHGFEKLGLNRIYLRVLASNPKACRFYEKLGFVSEGLARADSVLDGKFLDSVHFSALRGEFKIPEGI